MKKCIYCGAEVAEESVIDFCSKCGIGVWGEKMFNAIVKNMEEARKRDDLCSTNLNGGVAPVTKEQRFNAF